MVVLPCRIFINSYQRGKRISVPTYEKFMSPILAILSDNKIKSKKEIADEIIKHFKFTEQDLSETIPSQTQPT